MITAASCLVPILYNIYSGECNFYEVLNNSFLVVVAGLPILYFL